MKYETNTIAELIELSNGKELLLPNFQRDFVWDKEKQQKSLITSILYDIPIGSLLIIKGKRGDFSAKELGMKKQIEEIPEETVLYLLDGQQRLSTLKSIFYDFFDNELWKENLSNIYNRLHTRWFLRIEPKESNVDLFGWEKLKFDGEKAIYKHEPEEIYSSIICEVINKNQSNKWFHPDYKKEEWTEEGKVFIAAKQKIFSEKMAEEGVIPLYTLLVEPKSMALHYKTLQEIARRRVLSLKAQIDDGKINIDQILELPSKEYGDEECVEAAWRDLESNWINNISQFLDKIKEKSIPYIKLQKDEMSKAIHTFEQVNQGGTALSTYDLVVAKVAQYNKDEMLTDKIIRQITNNIEVPKSITQDLKGIESNYVWSGKAMKIMSDNGICNLFKDQYLNLLSIFSHVEYEDIDAISLEHMKKPKHLEMKPEQIHKNTEVTIKSLVRACIFLQFRCGVVSFEDLGYGLMLLPIAYVLRKDEFWNDYKVINKIEYWYWTSLFGGYYRETQNQRCRDDIIDLYKFVNGGENKFNNRENKVLDVEDYSTFEALTFKGNNITRTGAITRGIMQYVLSKQPRDFVNKNIYLSAWEIAQEIEYEFEMTGKKEAIKVEDHHIYPLGTAKKINQSTKELRSKKDFILNSVLNRTYISSAANRLISDKTVDDYFEYVSELSRYGHCVPNSFKDYKGKKSTDLQIDYYETIIRSRYDEILRDIKIELDKLR